MMVNPTFNWNPGCDVVVLVEEYIDGSEGDVDCVVERCVCVCVHGHLSPESVHS